MSGLSALHLLRIHLMVHTVISTGPLDHEFFGLEVACWKFQCLEKSANS